MTVYALAWTAALVIDPGSEDDARWEKPLDILLLTIGFVGMALFLSEVDHPSIRFAWKFVAPLLIGSQLWLFLRYMRSRREFLADLEVSEGELGWVELGAHAMLLPSLGINLAYAFA